MFSKHIIKVISRNFPFPLPLSRFPKEKDTNKHFAEVVAFNFASNYGARTSYLQDSNAKH
jgi:hypothetical protein